MALPRAYWEAFVGWQFIVCISQLDQFDPPLVDRQSVRGLPFEVRQ